MELRNKDYPEHVVEVTSNAKEFISTCSCGMTWTHGLHRTLEEIASIYESHLKYFNRPKMETL